MSTQVSQTHTQRICICGRKVLGRSLPTGHKKPDKNHSANHKLYVFSFSSKEQKAGGTLGVSQRTTRNITIDKITAKFLKPSG